MRFLRSGVAFVACCVFGLAACHDSAPPALDTPAAEHAEPAADVPRVVFLGDSLTAGSGLAESESFPAVIARILEDEGTPIQAANAGVSGDTSAGGRARLRWVLKQKPDVVVVELGANDGLRGQPVEGIEENLRAIVEGARAVGAKVLLVGMRLPPSLGRDYTNAFEAIYPRLAEELDVPLVPFLLEGVATVSALNLEDGLHPNARGHQKVAKTVVEHLRPLLAR
jgi:acyl-CoA thioesterase-1